jgi:LacI family transcriptional regulator
LVIAPDLIEYRPVEVMSSIPTILVNCLDPNANVPNIVPDEQGAGSAAARVLIEAGHSSIGVIAGPSDAMQSWLRLAGIQAAAAEQMTLSVRTVPKVLLQLPGRQP